VSYFNVAVSDIEARWRPLSDDESDVARILLSDADRILNNARPMLVGAIASTDPLLHIDGELAKIVLVDMVWRVLINPDSFRTTSVGADGSVGAGYFQPIEVLRPRIAFGPGDLDAIDRALRQTNQGFAIIQSRRMRNVDYGIPQVDMSVLPLP
jgi:hypothetical protein